MLLEVLSSISFVAIVAFLFTFAAILIELFLISNKDKVKKEKKDVVLPDFAEGVFKPIQTSKNTPLPVKKVAIDSAPRQLSSRYVVGLIGLCAMVFLIVAVSIMFKNNQEEVAETVVPTFAPQPTALQISPSASRSASLEEEEAELSLLEFDEEEGASGGADIQAQAPSPTVYSAPTATPSPVATTTIAPTTIASPTIAEASTSATMTPTKATTPTLLRTGGDYNASLIAALISFGLIAFAFMF